MKQYTFEEVLDKHIGKVGTLERDQFDKEVDEAVSAYRIGEAIKAERLRNMVTKYMSMLEVCYIALAILFTLLTLMLIIR